MLLQAKRNGIPGYMGRPKLADWVECMVVFPYTTICVSMLLVALIYNLASSTVYSHLP